MATSIPKNSINFSAVKNSVSLSDYAGRFTELKKKAPNMLVFVRSMTTIIHHSEFTWATMAQNATVVLPAAPDLRAEIL